MEYKSSQTNDSFIDQYKKIYSFLRVEWPGDKVQIIKDKVETLLSSATDSELSVLQAEILGDIRTALTGVDELGLRQSSIAAILLLHPVLNNHYSIDETKINFGEDTAIILKGLINVRQFSDRRSAVESENYVKLLLSIAEDIRVVFIMIAQHLRRMREAKNLDNAQRIDLSVEAKFLYAPLAHRLGLYNIKSELEDLSLKYTDRETYDFVARKLNETKRSRDKYIEEFIKPVKERLDKTGLIYDIKGRTKSIHSINNKLKKQKIEFESIYDLFAIRIILDSKPEDEKTHCWQVYSIITDMYQPNPKRLKDWLSIPKSNGYESLHITVMGPDSRWVEVQIRSRRMDEIAERGLAAHWKYKGLKSETGLDSWLQSLRESLDDKNSNLNQKLTDFKLDLYEEEIFVFSPKGDLFKLPKGATILDFAFSIHTKLGATCVSGKVNGKNVSIKHVLKSGDQVEINTSSNQTPKQDWLNFVVTSKARTKIRQILKEEEAQQVDIAKEAFARRLKNRKIELDDTVLMHLIKKLKYKTVTDFYADIASEKLEINWVIDKYLELENKGDDYKDPLSMLSAEEFTFHDNNVPSTTGDELIIDQNLTGIDYQLAKCCNPIYGDDIFGFVSSTGIKIHRVKCPNANNLFTRYGYRVIKARWSGKTGKSNYTVTLRVIGNDQLNIVANIMSIISKEEGIDMRSISIDSNDGLFQGNISVMLSDKSMLEQLIKKLKGVKGVKSINRLS
ncbi:MAG: RelA/SpoT family protein [Fermentimonas sp.]|jgi:guanosine-3',5'-bis(diphosphate) 3'-pyrophosphohydrolase